MPKAKKKAEWSLLIYIAAHNNLDSAGQRSLEQIISIASSQQLKLAVLFDGTTSAKRIVVDEKGKAPIVEALNDFDSGDPAALLESAKWAFALSPAKRYGVVLWSHGTGWRPEEIERIAQQARGDQVVSEGEANERSAGSPHSALFRSTLSSILQKQSSTERAICFDDGTQHSLDTLKLEWVAGEIRKFIGQPLDLLGMDACLMATAEIAYQLREHVCCLVASEELVPVTSWPYDAILTALQESVTMDAPTLAKQIVTNYAAYYEEHPPSGGDVTKIALDLRKLKQVVASMTALSETLIADIENQADALWAAQTLCLNRETDSRRRAQNKFQVHLWDLRTVASNLALQNDESNSGRALHKCNAAVKNAAEALIATLEPGTFVLAEKHQGAWFDGLGGLSIYLILPNRIRISPDYAALALANDSQWLNLLQRYDAEIKNR